MHSRSRPSILVAALSMASLPAALACSLASCERGASGVDAAPGLTATSPSGSSAAAKPTAPPDASEAGAPPSDAGSQLEAGEGPDTGGQPQPPSDAGVATDAADQVDASMSVDASTTPPDDLPPDDDPPSTPDDGDGDPVGDAGAADGDAPSIPDAGAVDGESADAAPPDAGAPVVDLQLYMAATGSSDAFDGLSPQTAVRTLARVHDLVQKLHPTGDVVITVAPGDYHCREMKAGSPWVYTAAKSVTIEPKTPVDGPAWVTETSPLRPVFHGHAKDGTLCSSGVWLPVRHEDTPVHFTLRGVTVTGYRGALKFENWSTPVSQIEQKCLVENVVFRQIGDKHYRPANYDPKHHAGKAAIMLHATRGNRFTQSLFRDIDNQDADDGATSKGLVHAFYLTGLARANRIDHNRFEGGTGSAIKITHHSNANVIEDNAFEGFPAAVVDRWCGAGDSAADLACASSPEGPQCPSWENQVYLSKNTFGGITKQPVVVWPIPEGQTCALSPAKSGVRLWLGPDMPVKK